VSQLVSRKTKREPVRAMKNMRHFLIRSLTQGALGMVLVVPVEKLISYTNATGRELPSPSLEAQG